MKRFAVLIILAALLAVSSQAQQPTLTVFAASSLTDAFTEIGRAFDTKNGTRTTFQFAGSQVLRTQLEQGARADVYASANNAQFDPLVKAGLIANGQTFTKNRLIVITPKRGSARVKTLADLGRPGVRLVVADPAVPVGTYTRQVFKSLETTYGAGFAARAQANVVSEEQNVRQVALKVQLGEADAGVVYTTDVTPTLRPNVIEIAIPTRFNVVASYPIGALSNASNAANARAFVNFVLSKDGQAILERWGFLKVAE
jgi:molybdate transport system substrate-binding protein